MSTEKSTNNSSNNYNNNQRPISHSDNNSNRFGNHPPPPPPLRHDESQQEERREGTTGTTNIEGKSTKAQEQGRNIVTKPRSSSSSSIRPPSSLSSSSSSSPPLHDRRPRLISRSSTEERGRSWISCTADRSMFHNRSSSPSTRYSNVASSTARMQQGSLSSRSSSSSRLHTASSSTTNTNIISRKDTPATATLDTDGWRHGKQGQGQGVNATSTSSQWSPRRTVITEEQSSSSSPTRAAICNVPTLREVQRVRSFSSWDRHPWRNNSDSSNEQQKQQWDEDDNASSDTASSYGHLSLPSDDCTGSYESSSTLQAGSLSTAANKSNSERSNTASSGGTMSGKKGGNIANTRRSSDKCAAFNSDAAPYQVRRRDEDVLDSNKSVHSIGTNTSYRSVGSGSSDNDDGTSSSTIFTPSVKIANEALMNYQQLISSSSSSSSSFSSSSSSSSEESISNSPPKHFKTRGPSPENHPYMKLKQIRRTSPPLKITSATTTTSSSAASMEKDLLSFPTLYGSNTATSNKPIIISPLSAISATLSSDDEDQQKNRKSYLNATAGEEESSFSQPQEDNIFRYSSTGGKDKDYTGPSIEHAKSISSLAYGNTSNTMSYSFDDDKNNYFRSNPATISNETGSVFRKSDTCSTKTEQETGFVPPSLETARCLSSDSEIRPSGQLLIGESKSDNDHRISLPNVGDTKMLLHGSSSSLHIHDVQMMKQQAHPVSIPSDAKNVFRSSRSNKDDEKNYIAPSIEKGRPISSSYQTSEHNIFRDNTKSQKEYFATPFIKKATSLSSSHDDNHDYKDNFSLQKEEGMSDLKESFSTKSHESNNGVDDIFRSPGNVDMEQGLVVPSIERAISLSSVKNDEGLITKEKVFDWEQKGDANLDTTQALDVIWSPSQAISYNNNVQPLARENLVGHGTPRPKTTQTSSFYTTTSGMSMSHQNLSSTSIINEAQKVSRMRRAFGSSEGSLGSIETGPPSPQRTRPPHDVAAEAMTPERMKRKDNSDTKKSGGGVVSTSTNKKRNIPLPSAIKRPSIGILADERKNSITGSSGTSSSSQSAGSKDPRKSPLRYDAAAAATSSTDLTGTTEKRGTTTKVVTFPQTWLKRGDDYNEELHHRASLSSLVYTPGDDDNNNATNAGQATVADGVGGGMNHLQEPITTIASAAIPSSDINRFFPTHHHLSAPDSPDRSKSSIPSFSYSLDGTVGSSNSFEGISNKYGIGQEIKFQSKQRCNDSNNNNHNNRYGYNYPSNSTNKNDSTSTMLSLSLPKIDEMKKTTTITTRDEISSRPEQEQQQDFLINPPRNNSPSSVITGSGAASASAGTSTSSSATTKDSINSIRDKSSSEDNEKNLTPGGTTIMSQVSEPNCSIPVLLMQDGETVTSDEIDVHDLTLPIETKTKNQQRQDTLDHQEEKQEIEKEMKLGGSSSTNGLAPIVAMVDGTAHSQIVPVSDTAKKEEVKDEKTGTATATKTSKPDGKPPSSSSSSPLISRWKLKPRKKNNSDEAATKPSLFVQPSPRDIILQRRKRMASPETNSILHQEDSSWEESNRQIVIPNTIVVEHPSKKPPGESQKEPAEDSSPGSLSLETSTEPSGSEHNKALILHVDGMSLIERDGQTSLEEECDNGMVQDDDGVNQFGDYGYPEYPNDNNNDGNGDLNSKEEGKLDESSKCTSYFSRRSEDLSQLIPKDSDGLGSLTPPKSEIEYRCARNRVVIIIVLSALIAVGASATVVALLLLRSSSADETPTSLSSTTGTPNDMNNGGNNGADGSNSGDGSFRPWPPIPPSSYYQPPTSNNNNNNNGKNEWPEIVLWSPEDEEVDTGSILDGLLDNEIESPISTTTPPPPFDSNQWYPLGQTISLDFTTTSSTDVFTPNDSALVLLPEHVRQRDMTFSMSGDGQYLGVGVPFDTNENGIGAGAVFLFKISSSSTNEEQEKDGEDTTQGRSRERMSDESKQEQKQTWGLVGLLLGHEDGSGFGSNVVLNEDGSTIVITSLGYNTHTNTGQNLVHVFKIEPIEVKGEAVVSSSVSEEEKRINDNDRRHLRGASTTQGSNASQRYGRKLTSAIDHYQQQEQHGGSGTTRKHEELYTHERYPDLIHHVKFISKALNHPTLPQGIMMHHTSISISDDGNVVSVLASPELQTIPPTTASQFQSLTMFRYDATSDTWMNMNIEFPSDFQPQYSWSCDLSGDGMTLAYSSVVMSRNDHHDDDNSGVSSAPTNNNYVMLWHWKDSLQLWESAEMFPSDLFGKMLRNNSGRERQQQQKEQQQNTKEEQQSPEVETRQSSSTSQQFGYSISLNVDGTLLAIGAPSIINDKHTNNNIHLDLGYAVVARSIAVDDIDGNGNSSTVTKVWGLAGDILKGTSFGYGTTVDLSNDGQRLVIGSYDHSVLTGGVTSVYQFDQPNNHWDKSPNFYHIDPSHIGLNVAISSDGTRVMTGRGVPVRTTNNDERIHFYPNDGDVKHQQAFVDVYYTTEKDVV